MKKTWLTLVLYSATTSVFAMGLEMVPDAASTEPTTISSTVTMVNMTTTMTFDGPDTTATSTATPTADTQPSTTTNTTRDTHPPRTRSGAPTVELPHPPVPPTAAPVHIDAVGDHHNHGRHLGWTRHRD